MPDDSATASTRAQSLRDVLDLYEQWGSHRYDEIVTQQDHAIQTAALARQANANDFLIAAALLHDVGHLLELRGGGDANGSASVDLGHDATGARWLGKLFPHEVTAPIAGHVAAKRYRCAVDAEYHAHLSAGSQRSLQVQGGPMSPNEVAAFERQPSHIHAVLLRGWDDDGKIEGLQIDDFVSYEALLRGLSSGP